jgi:RNA polymerase sigma-70 factor (ECF subfamily)
MTRSAPLPPTDPAIASQPIDLDPRITLAAAGDRQAAHALLVELLPRVRNLVRYLTRDDTEVDDISQHVLLELLKSFKTYRATGSLRSFADRITVRVTLRRKKQAAIDRTEQEAAGAELRALSSDVPGPDEYLRRREAVRHLDAIPMEQRQALVLHHVVGMSVPEVAEELGVPLETVRSRLRLAMGRLRRDEGEGKIGGGP